MPDFNVFMVQSSVLDDVLAIYIAKCHVASSNIAQKNGLSECLDECLNILRSCSEKKKLESRLYQFYGGTTTFYAVSREESERIKACICEQSKKLGKLTIMHSSMKWLLKYDVPCNDYFLLNYLLVRMDIMIEAMKGT
jgi:hypothetical protein